MEELSLRPVEVSLVNHDASQVRKDYVKFSALAFGISWLIWISAHLLGARPGVGEEILGFGAGGPVVAAILLSRSPRKVLTATLTPHLIWFGFFWPACWAIYVVSDKMRSVSPTVTLRFGLTVAALAAIPACIGYGGFSRDAGVRGLLGTLAFPRNWRWQAVAFLSFPTILLVPTVILHRFGVPVVWQRGNRTLWALAVYGAVTFARNLFFTAFLEEPGWRGYLLRSLKQRTSPLVASLLVWLPWALWHAPLDFSGGVGHNWLYYVQVRVVFLIPITVIMTWIYNRSGGNLLSTAIFHAGMNTFPFVLPYVPAGLGLIFVWAGYAIFSDKMWRRRMNTK